MIDMLHALGDRLLALGYSTPFLVECTSQLLVYFLGMWYITDWWLFVCVCYLNEQHIGYSYCYPNLETAKQAVLMMGEEIDSVGLPQQLLPMTFAFTSQGNVSQVDLSSISCLNVSLYSPIFFVISHLSDSFVDSPLGGDLREHKKFSIFCLTSGSLLTRWSTLWRTEVINNVFFVLQIHSFIH